LGLRDKAALASVFKTIPFTVETINLSNNYLNDFSEADWIYMLKKLPRTVTRIKCDGAAEQRINRVLQNIQEHAFNTCCDTTPLLPNILNLTLDYAVDIRFFSNQTTTVPLHAQASLDGSVLR
jgi:hypothetical protein